MYSPKVLEVDCHQIKLQCPKKLLVDPSYTLDIADLQRVCLLQEHITFYNSEL